MGLFEQIAGAIANPNQQASPDQLGSILSAMEMLSGNQGLNASTSQSVMSMLGGYVRSALQQQQANNGSGHVENLVNQFSGIGPSTDAVQAVFSPNRQTQVAQAISQQTGLSSEQVQGLLVAAVPLVLKMLQSGAVTQSGATNQMGLNSNNPVLSAFLDSDQDGDVDIGDAMAMAGRFLQTR
jgi:hypothetical protein